MSGIYDAFGRKIEPDKKPDDRVMAVASLRDRWSNYPSKGLGPERLATIFKEADAGDVLRQMELFEEMEEKDGHLLSILARRRLAVSGCDYEVRPFSEDKRDRAIADFVSNVIYGLPDFEDNLFDMLDAIGKGFSGLELLWDVKDDKHAVRHIEWIHPKRFTWAFAGAAAPISPRLITDESPMGMDPAPFKFIFHRHKTKSGHDTRQGVLRVCAWMYLFKNYSLKDWVAFAEVFGMPLRLGRYDPSASKEDKDALVVAVKSLGSDAAGIISKSTEIEFIEAAGKSGKDAVYEALATFCNAEMSKAVLGHSAGADSTPGKLGNEDMAVEVRDDLKKADCETAAKTIRRDLIRPLVGFNFGWDAPLPWFKLLYEDRADLDKEAARYKTLVETGLAIGNDHMYEKFGIPKPKDNEATIGGAAKPSPAENTRTQASADKHDLMANKESADGKDSVDALTERLMAEADFGRFMEPVAKMVAEAGSMEELRDNLIEAYKGMDEAELGNLLQRAFIAAELLGNFDAKAGNDKTLHDAPGRFKG